MRDVHELLATWRFKSMEVSWKHLQEFAKKWPSQCTAKFVTTTEFWYWPKNICGDVDDKLRSALQRVKTRICQCCFRKRKKNGMNWHYVHKISFRQTTPSNFICNFTNRLFSFMIISKSDMTQKARLTLVRGKKQRSERLLRYQFFT